MDFKRRARQIFKEGFLFLREISKTYITKRTFIGIVLIILESLILLAFNEEMVYPDYSLRHLIYLCTFVVPVCYIMMNKKEAYTESERKLTFRVKRGIRILVTGFVIGGAFAMRTYLTTPYHGMALLVICLIISIITEDSDSVWIMLTTALSVMLLYHLDKIVFYDPFSFTDWISGTTASQVKCWHSFAKLYNIASWNADCLLNYGNNFLKMELRGSIPAEILCYSGKLAFCLYTLCIGLMIVFSVRFVMRILKKGFSEHPISDALILGVAILFVMHSVVEIIFMRYHNYYLRDSIVLALLLLGKKAWDKRDAPWREYFTRNKTAQLLACSILFAAMTLRICLDYPFYEYESMEGDHRTIQVSVLRDSYGDPMQTVSRDKKSHPYSYIYEEDLKKSRIVRFRENAHEGYFDAFSGEALEISNGIIKHVEPFNGLMTCKDVTGKWSFYDINRKKIYESSDYNYLQALPHCCYLIKSIKDNTYKIVDMKPYIDVMPDHIIEHYVVPDNYTPSIIKENVVVFTSNEGKSIICWLEREKVDGNSEISHWERKENHWRTKEIDGEVCDIYEYASSLHHSNPEAYIYSYSNGNSYEVVKFDIENDTIEPYEDDLDEKGYFTPDVLYYDSIYSDKYKVPVAIDNEGVKWRYGVVIF